MNVPFVRCYRKPPSPFLLALSKAFSIVANKDYPSILELHTTDILDRTVNMFRLSSSCVFVCRHDVLNIIVEHFNMLGEQVPSLTV